MTEQSPVFVSIDQNSHTLWDSVPKLQALVRQGWSGIHCVEDVDVAFTRRGAAVDDTFLRLTRERYYRGGTSDWGAALFYTDFLGRNPLDVRSMEPYTGWTTAALSRRLDCTVDSLYDRYSPSDNWQLIGSSYYGDTEHHRTIGDLRVEEVTPFLRELMQHARTNMLTVFPEADAQARVNQWFEQENAKLCQMLFECANGHLTDLYRQWMRAELPAQVRVRLTSELMSTEADNGFAVLEIFLRDYDKVSALYNEAVEETGTGVSKLARRDGELPFFLVWRINGHLLRTAAYIDGGTLRSGNFVWELDRDGRLPLPEMRADGVCAVSGKALLLVVQARMLAGAPLALPYKGSLYMPAARRLQEKLARHGVLQTARFPVYRVKLNFLQQLRGCGTVIRPPRYLAEALGADELTASALSEAAAPLAADAAAELRALATESGREEIKRLCAPAQYAQREALDRQRRDLARDPETRQQAGELWDRIKEIDREILACLVDRIHRNLHIHELDYWNSRGAILPWSIALGGQPLYNRLLADAEIYAE